MDEYNNPAFSLVPAPINVPQAPPVPSIAGVAPAQFHQTQCDAGVASNIGSIDRAAQSEGLPVNNNGLMSNPAAVGMNCGNGIINSLMGRASSPAASARTVQGNSAGGSSADSQLGALLGKAAGLGINALGGISGIANKVGCLLGLSGGISGEAGGLGSAADFGINDAGTGFTNDALNSGFGDLINADGSLTSLGADLGGNAFGGAESLAAADAFACAAAAAAADAGASAAGDIAASDGAAAAASAASDAAMSIICTELYKQGRISRSRYVASSAEFQKFSKTLIAGYYHLGRPAVRHLQNHPNSLLSKFLEKVMNWQAEHAAAKRNYKGAKRRPIIIAIMALIMWPTCYILGKTVAHPVGGSIA